MYFDDPAEWAKIQTYSKNTQRSILHNKIFNELFVIQIFYFMGISYQAEKQSRSRSIVCVGNQLNSYVFLQYKITYCPNIEWYLYLIHTLFVLHTVHLDKNLISYCLAVHRIKRKLSH